MEFCVILKRGIQYITSTLNYIIVLAKGKMCVQTPPCYCWILDISIMVLLFSLNTNAKVTFAFSFLAAHLKSNCIDYHWSCVCVCVCVCEPCFQAITVDVFDAAVGVFIGRKTGCLYIRECRVVCSYSSIRIQDGCSVLYHIWQLSCGVAMLISSAARIVDGDTENCKKNNYNVFFHVML